MPGSLKIRRCDILIIVDHCKKKPFNLFSIFYNNVDKIIKYS